MPVVSYSLAISLDGYLAREDGSVDWLENFKAPENTPYSHANYFKSVSALIMGRKTYEKVLSFGEYCYGGKPALVVTSDRNFVPDQSEVNTVTIDELSLALTKLGKNRKDKVWLVGGGQLAAHCMGKGLIDELVVGIIPVTIGNGIPWIENHKLDTVWDLKETFFENGIGLLIYRKKIV